MRKLNKSVSSLAAELLVVIVGILMAISIDSWWTGIGNHRTERELLGSLAEEFETNQSLLDRQFEAYEHRSAAAETLLRLGPDATVLTVDSLTALWRWVTRGGSYDPSTGVLDAASASGDIRLIRDPALRVALAEWPGKVDNLTNVEGIVGELLYVQLVPWLRLQTALPKESFGEFGIPPSRILTDFELLSSSFVVENFLREIVAWGRILESARRGLDKTMDSVQTGIGRSLPHE